MSYTHVTMESVDLIYIKDYESKFRNVVSLTVSNCHNRAVRLNEDAENFS